MKQSFITNDIDIYVVEDVLMDVVVYVVGDDGCDYVLYLDVNVEVDVDVDVVADVDALAMGGLQNLIKATRSK